jgi:Tol biopolymer transport system component
MRKLVIAIISLMLGGSALAEPPQGYLVWIKGELGSKTSRKVYRMTLPEKSDVMALTSGEDVECQISPDGKWVAYAKSKLPDTDYHQFERWKLYLVSIHGVGDGREEIKIDDNGYWPSWGDDNVLYYLAQLGGRQRPVLLPGGRRPRPAHQNRQGNFGRSR